MHKELFGSGTLSQYGLNSHQRFFDIQERVVLDVKALIEYDGNIHPPIKDFKQDFSIEIGEQEYLLSKRVTPTNARARKRIRNGYY